MDIKSRKVEIESFLNLKINAVYEASLKKNPKKNCANQDFFRFVSRLNEIYEFSVPGFSTGKKVLCFSSNDIEYLSYLLFYISAITSQGSQRIIVADLTGRPEYIPATFKTNRNERLNDILSLIKDVKPILYNTPNPNVAVLSGGIDYSKLQKAASKIDAKLLLDSLSSYSDMVILAIDLRDTKLTKDLLGLCDEYFYFYIDRGQEYRQAEKELAVIPPERMFNLRFIMMEDKIKRSLPGLNTILYFFLTFLTIFVIILIFNYYSNQVQPLTEQNVAVDTGLQGSDDIIQDVRYNFSISVGVFNELDKALELRSELIKASLDAYICPGSDGVNTFYRLLVGKYRDKTGAEIDFDVIRKKFESKAYFFNREFTFRIGNILNSRPEADKTVWELERKGIYAYVLESSGKYQVCYGFFSRNRADKAMLEQILRKNKLTYKLIKR